MKKNLLSIALCFFTYAVVSAQCGLVSIIGEHTGWADDLVMTQDLNDLNKWSFDLGLLAGDDGDMSGFVEMKFRSDFDWAVNWGDAAFPSGTATAGGNNVLVPVGSYHVEFDCSTGEYSFTTQCGQVGLIGEMTEWGSDINMHRDASNPDMWTGFVSLLAGQDADGSGFVDLKFRENADWGVNWGDSAFPSGTAVDSGDNIPVPPGAYFVSFNCATGEYSFDATCGPIGLIGEMTEWSSDINMHRSATNPDMWSAAFTVTADQDADGSGAVDLKFRQNADWGVNWGDSAFPSGTAVDSGDNIPVPPGSYVATFNCATGEYNFQATCGSVGIIGAFTGWAYDIDMVRDDSNPDMLSIDMSFPVDTELKFRQNDDWGVNWGGDDFPSGATSSGNIPVTAGTYTINFNCSTGDYSFDASSSLPCGSIGIIGDFNGFGVDPNDPTGPATDVLMIRDQESQSDFSLFYNFDGPTNLYFREDQDASFMSVWGGTTFPQGVGVQDAAVQLPVLAGKYNIDFNCTSGQYNFTRLGNSATAPKVFNISVDGDTSEADWTIDRAILNVDGDIGDDMANWGATYNDEFLFVAVNVVDDQIIQNNDESDGVLIFVDANKDGGEYDPVDDVAFAIYPDGTGEFAEGNDMAMVQYAAQMTSDGYSVEAAIPWADLGVVAADLTSIGFDVAVGDSEDGDVQGVYFWNGGEANLDNTSGFGDLNLGILNCGQISMYSDAFGDVNMYTTQAAPTTYIATYEFSAESVVNFRKDNSNVVQWGASDFPSGTAALDGPGITVPAGRYLVSFNCETNEYSFADAAGGDCLAAAEFTSMGVAIDGDLSEYDLDLGLIVGSVDGGALDNTINWSSRWDDNNLYLGFEVIDDAVVSSGASNPWEQDAIEIYLDGNNDGDGDYDLDTDVQIIVYDNDGTPTAWTNGGAGADIEAMFSTTASGYNVEVRYAWSNFGFSPVTGSNIGFSIGMNDADDMAGTRDDQSVWCGTSTNYNNTSELGDLTLRGETVSNENVLINNEIGIFPNPTSGLVRLKSLSESFDENTIVTVTTIGGAKLITQVMDLSNTNTERTIDLSNFNSGVYVINIIASNGKMANKMIVKE